MRLKGYIGLSLVCLFYWVLDSIWSYLSFEVNLRNLIYSQPASYLDTFLLRVPPHQIISRLMVVVLFAILGSLILEFMIKKQAAEKNRREAHDTLLTILNSIDATIYVADIKSHEILFMNKYMIDVFGGDFRGRICHETFRNSKKVCDHCTNDRLLDESGRPKGVVVWEGRNPVTEAWYVNYDRAIKWVDGRLVRIQIATDITRIKELQEKQLQSEAQLRQAHKMEAVGTLAGGVAHDFNNILAAIIGFAELALLDLPAGLPARSNLDQILRSALRGRDLVKQILSFSRRSEQERIPIHLEPVVRETLKMLRATVPTTIEITQEFGPDLAVVEADPTQMHQLILNLAGNAVDAMKESGGTLAVRVENITVDRSLAAKHLDLKEGRYLKITVEDSGTGIPPEILARIFDPFFTTKGVGSGTGMGLSVVHGIVQSHGGVITVESSPGQGAAFHLYLPAAESQAGAVRPEPEGRLVRGHERVLFVDDEQMLVEFAGQMLTTLGYQTTIKTSSLEALEAFKVDPDSFDLVITDMTMPQMTGADLAKEILSIRPEVPIILCTGYSDQIDEAKAGRIGIRRLIIKPLSVSDTSLAIREVLDGRRTG